VAPKFVEDIRLPNRRSFDCVGHRRRAQLRSGWQRVSEATFEAGPRGDCI